MECATRGHAVVPAIIENQHDLYEVSQGRRKPEDVRRVEVPDAAVDTGAKMLSLPKRLVAQLGLQFIQSWPVITTAGAATVDTYGMVKLRVMDREAPLECRRLAGQMSRINWLRTS